MNQNQNTGQPPTFDVSHADGILGVRRDELVEPVSSASGQLAVEAYLHANHVYQRGMDGTLPHEHTNSSGDAVTPVETGESYLEFSTTGHPLLKGSEITKPNKHSAYRLN